MGPMTNSGSWSGWGQLPGVPLGSAPVALSSVEITVPPPAPTMQEPRDEPIAPTSIVAPIVSAPNDDRDRAGVLAQVPPRDDSRGSGRGGGAGTGAGVGIGEGDGAGVGPGTGGGFGGGAYRPGNGVEIPRLCYMQGMRPDGSMDRWPR